jgi:hypothetical protein
MDTNTTPLNIEERDDTVSLTLTQREFHALSLMVGFTDPYDGGFFEYIRDSGIERAEDNGNHMNSDEAVAYVTGLRDDVDRIHKAVCDKQGWV